ncbi:unnamed protein product [Haemonchus placei]|uniref:Expressed conserved protein n=1 Tax=Haemonchus placei TaxID=6290 RepID=A0A0N4X7G0_HAEPC|nr:unnamed protein product [Haemonchus placei]
MDDFNAYRAMCANRLRRLERYRKARSFCNIDDENPSSASEHFFTTGTSRGSGSAAFEVIREKMLSLMENDMSLLQQLLTLGDQITEMKKLKEQSLRKSQSHTSLGDEYDSEVSLQDQFDDEFSPSMSAVTTLKIGETEPQYFSRQNSVLRIPIPPRSSNRFGHRKIPRRPSEMMRTAPSFAHYTASATVHSDDVVEAVVASAKAVECCPIDPTYMTTKNRSSNSSIDSGIRESSSSESPSPTFGKEVV